MSEQLFRQALDHAEQTMVYIKHALNQWIMADPDAITADELGAICRLDAQLTSAASAIAASGRAPVLTDFEASRRVAHDHA